LYEVIIITNDILSAALAYAEQGFLVFPIKSGGKTPLTENGFKDATISGSSIRSWFEGRVNGTRNIAICTGQESGFFVIDVDPRNNGHKSAVLSKLGVPTVATGGGGYHYYFKYPAESIRWRKTLDKGIDIKADNGYVLVPPSVTSAKYSFIATTHTPSNLQTILTEAPAWLVEACIKPEINPAKIITGHVTSDVTDTRPGSVFNRTASWSGILEPHGWVAVREEDGEVNGEVFTETFWRRPGKAEGVSATTNYDGHDYLYVFTSSAEPLESGTAYTKFAAQTNLNYGGNYSAASRALANGFAMAGPTITTPYSFTPATEADHFVQRYIDYASKQTDAPTEYHEAGALTLLSMATSRCRASLAPYPGGLRNNLYITLVGTQGQSRKSTAQRIAIDIAKAVMPASILPNRATTEALIKSLSQHNGIPAIWTPDEFGVALAEMYSRTFMAGLEELLLSAYSGDDYIYERSNDTLTIRQPYLSVLAAATPESISRTGGTALESGLLPRFAVVYPKTLPAPKPVGNSVPDLAVERANLISFLKDLLTWTNSNDKVTFTKEALKILNDAESGLVGRAGSRLPAMLYKVSALLSLASNNTSVERNMAEAAVVIVNRWRTGMENLVPLLSKGGSDPVFTRQAEYALDIVVNHSGRVARTVIAEALRLKASRVDELERALIDWGQINLDVKNGHKIWMRP
jgi:hypothetical protein